jgi:hypothetical protein
VEDKRQWVTKQQRYRSQNRRNRKKLHTSNSLIIFKGEGGLSPEEVATLAPLPRAVYDGNLPNIKKLAKKATVNVQGKNLVVLYKTLEDTIDLDDQTL